LAARDEAERNLTMAFEIISKSGQMPGTIDLTPEQALWLADALAKRAEIYETARVRVDPGQHSLFEDRPQPQPVKTAGKTRKPRAAKPSGDGIRAKLIRLLTASTEPMGAADIAADIAYPRAQILDLLKATACVVGIGVGRGRRYTVDRAHPDVITSGSTSIIESISETAGADGPEADFADA
jgi:hypothetical protein